MKCGILVGCISNVAVTWRHRVDPKRLRAAGHPAQGSQTFRTTRHPRPPAVSVTSIHQIGCGVADALTAR